MEEPGTEGTVGAGLGDEMPRHCAMPGSNSQRGGAAGSMRRLKHITIKPLFSIKIQERFSFFY